MTRWDIDEQSHLGRRRYPKVIPYLPALLLAAWVVARLLV
jgi:hypothetical protein